MNKHVMHYQDQYLAITVATLEVPVDKHLSDFHKLIAWNPQQYTVAGFWGWSCALCTQMLTSVPLRSGCTLDMGIVLTNVL